MKDYKHDLLTRLWNVHAGYYDTARDASETCVDRHHDMQTLAQLIEQSGSVLDCGCGEGTMLDRLASRQRTEPAYGVDISRLAVSLGKSRHPHIRFLVADLEKGLPFPAGHFGCVYMAFAAEHLSNPDAAVEEMMRVVRPGGWLAILSPNFGSPFFPSPCARGSFRRRQFRRLLRTHGYLLRGPRVLDWDAVVPRALSEEEWQSDWDTTVEPYLQTLVAVLEHRGVRITLNSSMWSLHQRASKRWWQRIAQIKVQPLFRCCRTLGEWGIPPYRYYGPVFFVVGQKESLVCASYPSTQ